MLRESVLALACACVGAAAANLGMSLMFDMADDYVGIPPFAFGGGPYTLEAWVRACSFFFAAGSHARARTRARAFRHRQPRVPR